ncbi:hypothetical protein FS749_000881 [Ceratobasidium sp. UAMH 11750]|nr:hypothetical protein FS749_000881 [Ceratobasidium sp. UAMH 11750]
MKTAPASEAEDTRGRESARTQPTPRSKSHGTSRAHSPSGVNSSFAPPPAFHQVLDQIYQRVPDPEQPAAGPSVAAKRKGKKGEQTPKVDATASDPGRTRTRAQTKQ